jgi:hypothetical protein
MADDEMLVLARHDQRAQLAPAVSPGQIECRQDFDPSSQDRADMHGSAFALSDDLTLFRIML